MKIKSIGIALILLCCIPALVFYTQAMRVADPSQELKEAIIKKDTPAIYELIVRMNEQMDKNRDVYPQLVKEVREYRNTCTDTSSRAILASMIAQLYSNYYQANSWKINQRTSIIGYIPESMEVWTSNIFTDTVLYYVKESLSDARLLQKTPVSEFSQILIKGEDSPKLRPTLFDFLSYRGISCLNNTNRFNGNGILTGEVKAIYQHLIAFRKQANNPAALLMAELDYANYLLMGSTNETSKKRYVAVLDSLQQQYGNNDFSVEVAIARLNSLYLYSAYGQENDSLQAVAYRLCKDEIEKYPDYPRIAVLKDRLSDMTRPTVSVSTSRTVYPGKLLTIKASYRNVSQITVTFYHSKQNPQELFRNSEYLEKPEQYRGGKLSRIIYNLRETEPYSLRDTTITIPMDKTGLYECEITAGENISPVSTPVSVTRLFTAVRSLKDGNVLVTDMESGKPIAGADVIFYSRKDYNAPLKQLSIVKTNKDGLAASVTDAKAYRVVHGTDKAMLVSSFYGSNYSFPKANEDRTVLSLFSDRSIYRPGQTLFFKGIAYKNNENSPLLLNNQTFTVSLRDANNEEITKKEFTTNDFGSFNGSFTLPQQTLAGRFSLSTSNGSLSFQVEEYKRPTFFVNFKPVKEDISFGEELTLQGTAQTFSGANLQDALLSYRIVRHSLWPRFNFNTIQVAEGNLTISGDGNFSISFRPEKPEEDFNRENSSYRYEVIALVTDSKGENEQGNFSFAVGNRSMLLSATVGDKMDKDKAALTISAANLNNQPVQTTGKFSLFLLEDKKNLLPEEDITRLPVRKEVYNGTFTAAQPIDAKFMNQLPSGYYLLTMQANDSRQRLVADSAAFVLYGQKDKKPPVTTPLWFVPVVTECTPGEDAEVIFGTSDKKAYVLYEIIQRGKTIERKRMELSDENKTFRIPFVETYGEGINVSFTFVKDGNVYNQQQAITRKLPSHELIFKTETFRDRLLPGQKESWRFRITNADSVPVLAEVLASMYDASLDKIVPHRWFFNPIRSVYISTYPFSKSEIYNLVYLSGNAKNQAEYIPAPEFRFDELNWQGLFTMNLAENAVMVGSGMVKRSILAKADSSPVTMVGSIASAESERLAFDQESALQVPSPAEPETPVQIRSNFDETAFFYPTLLTDKDGSVMLNFEVPESNTTWKLMMLANTRDLKYGQLTKEAISQKKLMVLPNLPRFMRWGDQVSVSTQVINLSEKEITGRVRLELFDPETDKLIVCLTKSERPFTVAAGDMASASWIVPVPDSTNLIGCRIIAESAEASDGEQQLIPVLPNELMVTESTPFTVLGTGDKTIKNGWSPLSSTARPFRMTLEYSNNPAWYAVQALPSITLPDNKSVISWFAAYYGNTLASYIANSTPRVKDMIRQWAAQGGNSDAFYSTLEKNQELKNILLQETPWVLQAKNETEQKQRLALLFNLNNTTSQRKNASEMLVNLQNTDGSWSWYKDMPGNSMLTLYVLKGMSQLTHLNAIEYNEQEKMMQINALRFLDNSVKNQYKEWQKTTGSKPQLVPVEMLEFLFVRSGYRDIPENGDAREAIRYYTLLAEQTWKKQSLYGKALTAQLMYRNGNKSVALDIISALRKVATHSGDMGMYWANNTASEVYFVSPVDIHCRLMDAFNEIAPDTTETDAMKLWLLKQKQTQRWASVPATVNAIYALLRTGSNWLDNTGNSTLTWGKETYNTASGEVGTGYIQESVNGSAIIPEMETITVHKTSEAPAWGAVYRQYFQKITAIPAIKGNLNVEKKLFIERNSANGPMLYPVTKADMLKVGDKVVVRLVVTTDRTMDYVLLKDLRAGCFEPAVQLSGMMYQDGSFYYRSPGDVSENFFFNRLEKGTYVLEYAVYVSRSGQYAGGISTIQCMYAPEFVSHTEGNDVIVK